MIPVNRVVAEIPARLDPESAEWLRVLGAGGAGREAALARPHGVLARPPQGGGGGAAAPPARDAAAHRAAGGPAARSAAADRRPGTGGPGLPGGGGRAD